MKEIKFENLPYETKEMISMYCSLNLDDKLFNELLTMCYHHGYVNGKNEKQVKYADKNNRYELIIENSEIDNIDNIDNIDLFKEIDKLVDDYEIDFKTSGYILEAINYKAYTYDEVETVYISYSNKIYGPEKDVIVNLDWELKPSEKLEKIKKVLDMMLEDFNP